MAVSYSLSSRSTIRWPSSDVEILSNCRPKLISGYRDFSTVSRLCSNVNLSFSATDPDNSNSPYNWVYRTTQFSKWAICFANWHLRAHVFFSLPYTMFGMAFINLLFTGPDGGLRILHAASGFQSRSLCTLIRRLYHSAGQPFQTYDSFWATRASAVLSTVVGQEAVDMEHSDLTVHQIHVRQRMSLEGLTEVRSLIDDSLDDKAYLFLVPHVQQRLLWLVSTTICALYYE